MLFWRTLENYERIQFEELTINSSLYFASLRKQSTGAFAEKLINEIAGISFEL